MKRIKVFKYGRYEEGTNGLGVLVLDEKKETIEVLKLKGHNPKADELLRFLMKDKHVRRLIRDYQNFGERKTRYKISFFVGSTGRMDCYINYYNKYKIQTYRKHLMHVSMYNKTDGIPKMWIGDFAEMIAAKPFGGLLKSRKELIKDVKKCGYKYIYYPYIDENASASTDICDII